MMYNDDAYWEKNLSRAPYPHKRFTDEMMLHVERRLQVQEKRDPKGRRWTPAAAMAVCSLLLLALLVPGWWLVAGGGKTSLPPPHMGAPELTLQIGDGGDQTAWSLMGMESYRQTDQTIIQFTVALLQKQLGAMGGPAVPADSLWEDASKKKVLAVYEISSPWVAAVHILRTAEQSEFVIYDLEITLTDSTQAVSSETLQVEVSKESGLIREVLIIKDEGGSDEKTDEIVPSGVRHVLAEDAEQQFRLYGIKEPDSGMIRAMELETQRGGVKSFEDWSNVDNETYYPVIWVNDVTGDGEPDILVQLVTGYGTGTKVTELRVLNRQLEELRVADPVAAMESLVETTLERDGERRIYHFKTGQTEHSVPYDEEENAGNWFDTAVFGNIVDYSVYLDTIYATVSVQVSPGLFPLSAMVRFGYADGSFTPIEVELMDLN